MQRKRLLKKAAARAGDIDDDLDLLTDDLSVPLPIPKAATARPGQRKRAKDDQEDDDDYEEEEEDGTDDDDDDDDDDWGRSKRKKVCCH